MNRILIAAIVLGTSSSALADFADDFQVAKELLDERDYPAAHQASITLAASAPNDHGKAWSLCHAAIALGLQKQYDQAIELAKTIGSKPMAAYTQMEIMGANRRHRELIAAFREEDVAAWPDQINYRGCFLRGAAFAVIRDSEAAAKDFEQCAALSGSDSVVKLEALNRSAALWSALKDDAKAMATFKRAFAIYDEQPRWKGKWLYPQAVLGATRILMGQGKYGDAKAMLAKFSVSPSRDKRGAWDFLVLEAYGDLALAEGKRDEALAKYRDAVAIETHKSYIERVNKKINPLQEE